MAMFQDDKIYVPISATPDMPIYTTSIPQASQNNTTQVKVATPDIVLFNDDSLPVEVITDLIFEDIGGQELINIARNDIVNGQRVSYNIISNLTKIQRFFNPNNIVSLQQTSDKFFENFSIDLNSTMPNYPDNVIGGNVSIELATGDLIIELVNLKVGEQVEVQITTSGTIYEVNL